MAKGRVAERSQTGALHTTAVGDRAAATPGLTTPGNGDHLKGEWNRNQSWAGPDAGVCRRGFGGERTSVGPGDLRGKRALLAPRGAGAGRVGDLGLGCRPPQGRTRRRCVVNAVVVEFDKTTNDAGLF